MPGSLRARLTGATPLSAARALLAVTLALATAGLYLQNVGAHAFLADDAFISFRYARHWVEGLGLVWNPGERIEGYTNFLWVVLLAAGLRLGIAPETLAPALGAASGAGVLLGLAWLSARRHGWSDPFTWLAPLVLATSRSFTAWSTGGLETQLFSLLVLLGLLRHGVERERRAPWPVGSALLLAAATLTRPEGALFTFAVAVGWGLDVLRGRRRLAAAVVWLLPWLLVVGTHLLWRHAYYGFWLPNTFYAKVHGLWLEQAGKYFGIFQDDYRLAWFVPLGLLPLIVRRAYLEWLFAGSLALYLAYVVAIGGDRFEFRFLVPVLPYAYWLIGEGIRWLARPPLSSLSLRGAFALAGAALAGLLWAATYAGSIRPEADELRHNVEPLVRTRLYALKRAEEGLLLRRLIERGVLPRDLLLATGGVGALPYYTGWPTVDLMGLNDVRIAHTPLAERGVIAHEHRASSEYLRERRVEVLDFLGRLVHTRESFEQNTRLYRMRVRRTRDKGRLVAVHLDPRAFLLFRTMLSDEELRVRLPGLTIENLPE